MKRLHTIILLLCLALYSAYAQDYNQLNDDGTFVAANSKQFGRSDSIQSKHKEIPKGFHTWTIDSRYGDRTMVEPDTASYMFMNSIYTSGVKGDYNFLGNLGSPRYSRIFIDNPEAENFIFTEPYSYFMKPIDEFHFTNTYSPITNLTFNTCGDRTNGEDHLTAKFAVNAGKRLGVGFLFDYLYGRGYYPNQSTSMFNYTVYGSYLGDRYQAHFRAALNHQKMAENGGIADDRYITNPESFNDDYDEGDIPTVLSQNWNRNDNQHIFFNQRYSIGFHRTVPMTEEEIRAKKFAIESEKEQEEARKRRNNDYDSNGRSYDGRPDDAAIAMTESNSGDGGNSNDSIMAGERIRVDGVAMADSLLKNTDTDDKSTWTKREYVPVTSFIHTAEFKNFRRIYQAYQTPENFYLDEYYNIGKFTGDSIYDKTRHYELSNTFAVALLEGFNKWAKAGVKAFVAHDLRHYTLPNATGTTDKYNENTISVGGQISKTQGKTLHYALDANFGIAGAHAGDISLDGSADVNIPFMKDTLQIAADAFYHRDEPSFYHIYYHSRHAWWENDDFQHVIHNHIGFTLSMPKTRTTLRIAADNINNYAYFGTDYTYSDENKRIGNTVNARQTDKNISVFTAQLSQSFSLKPVNLDIEATYQKSSDDVILPLPKFNLYANLYVRFKIARVLRCDFGADMRYFTRYAAPEYVPYIGQFAVCENAANRTEIGNYPYFNIYANLHLKQTRFFVIVGHVNAGSGKQNFFLTPHYPTNQRVIRLGLSWNFFN